MKKRVIIIITLIISLSFCFVFAEGINVPALKLKQETANLVQNKKTIVMLNKQVDNKMKIVKKTMNDIKTDRIDKNKISDIKKYIENISKVQKSLVENNNTLNNTMAQMKKAIKKNDLEMYIKSCTAANKAQELRIKELKLLLKLLDRLALEALIV